MICLGKITIRGVALMQGWVDVDEQECEVGVGGEGKGGWMGLNDKEKWGNKTKGMAEMLVSFRKRKSTSKLEHTWRRRREEELVCVCIWVNVSACACAEMAVWQGDGLPVLCHAFSNQPTATSWGWREWEGSRGGERQRGEKQRKAAWQRKTKEVVNNKEKQINAEWSTRAPCVSGWRVRG